jgi:hypothetical protein
VKPSFKGGRHEFLQQRAEEVISGFGNTDSPQSKIARTLLEPFEPNEGGGPAADPNKLEVSQPVT